MNPALGALLNVLLIGIAILLGGLIAEDGCQAGGWRDHRPARIQ